ncbi:Uncharacterised protein [Mycobacterium tuberculosis]|nr:Uncharacterised protein [Mycobacterium tuberculosis]
MPAYVLASKDGIPNSISATSGGPNPSPNSSTPSSRTPNVGKARKPLTAPTTSSVPRPVCPISSPTGTAISAEAATATAVYSRCSHVRTAKPTGPVQLLAVSR